MSRFLGGGSYGHNLTRVGPDHWRLAWTVDRYVKGSRLRFPQTQTRDTDEAGAKRFAKRWGIEL